MRGRKRLLKDESGATSIEYAVILGLIFAAVIGAVTLVGIQLNNSWRQSGNQIRSATR